MNHLKFHTFYTAMCEPEVKLIGRLFIVRLTQGHPEAMSGTALTKQIFLVHLCHAEARLSRSMIEVSRVRSAKTNWKIRLSFRAYFEQA